MPSRRALVVWAIIAAMSVPLLSILDRRLSTLGAVRGSESAAVDRRVRDSFDSPFASSALLVLSGLRPSAELDSTRADVRAIVSPFLTSPAVTGVISPASSLDTLLLGADGTTALVIVGLKRDVPGAIDSLRALTGAMLPALRHAHPLLTLRWTGEQAVVEDLRRESVLEARAAEWRAFPVTALIAAWAFGSVTAALVAMIAAALVIAVSLGALGAIAGLMEPSILVRTVVPFIGLALTVDYSLFIRRGATGGMSRAFARRIVAGASIVVAIGFGGLIVAPTGELRSAAVGGMIAAALAGLAAISLTPWPSVATAAEPATARRWTAWGWLVMRRPVSVFAACGLPLVLLAREATRAEFVTPLEGWIPSGIESGDALADLAHARREGVAGTLAVLLDLPPGEWVLSTAGWEALTRAGRALRGVQGVADVHSLATIGTGSLLVARDVMPRDVRSRYVSLDGHSALLDVVPSTRRGWIDAVAVVTRLRSLDAAQVTGIAGSRLAVAGLPAYALDYEIAVRAALSWIIAGTAIATFLALLIFLRAPVVALKAVVLNLLVAAAAVGATVMVFESAFIMHAVGRAPLTSVFPSVPALAFAATFGMSMDYELFLLGGVVHARAIGTQEAREGAGQEAIVAGLARTGPVIVRAAAIMAGVFMAFSTCALPALAMIGFALAVAVAIDATIVRLALAPAFLRLAGRW
ncbi:MAG: MMPL family transporter, partial [Gemmatimonadales bacterium]